MTRFTAAIAVLAIWGSLGAAAAAEHEILALTDEMRRFVATHVDPRANPDTRLRQLAAAVIDPATLGMRYETVTRTAAEAFEARGGNCFSFSAMFIALARHAGLDASFQEVDVPPDWSLRDGTFVLNQHVNVLVDLGWRGRQVIDFNITDYRAAYTRRILSDTRAAARYWNNRGVERMEANDRDGALAAFRRAIDADEQGFSPAWMNLGTFHMRDGNRARAEAAYLEALRVRPDDLSVMSNLARFYTLTGDSSRAAVYRARVARYRNRNPYYRYMLALEAYSNEDYDAAIAHLKRAIRARPDDDRFYFLLALVHHRQGDERSARQWMLAAQRAAPPGKQERYAQKLERLGNSEAGKEARAGRRVP